MGVMAMLSESWRDSSTRKISVNSKKRNMLAYNRNRYKKKGLNGTRRSCDTAHRRRCLRVNKRGARQEAADRVKYEAEEWAVSLSEE